MVDFMQERKIVRAWIDAAQEFGDSKIGLVQFIEKTLRTYEKMGDKAIHYSDAINEDFARLEMGLQMARVAASMTEDKSELTAKRGRKPIMSEHSQLVEKHLLMSKNYRDVMQSVFFGGLGTVDTIPEVDPKIHERAINGARKRLRALRRDFASNVQAPKIAA